MCLLSAKQAGIGECFLDFGVDHQLQVCWLQRHGRWCVTLQDNEVRVCVYLNKFRWGTIKRFLNNSERWNSGKANQAHKREQESNALIFLDVSCCYLLMGLYNRTKFLKLGKEAFISCFRAVFAFVKVTENHLLSFMDCDLACWHSFWSFKKILSVHRQVVQVTSSVIVIKILVCLIAGSCLALNYQKD